MNNLIQYLQDNKIYFEEIDDRYIDIANKRYFLVLPEEDKLFSEDFILMADRQDCDRYVYNFGGNWYWEEKSDYDSPKLNQLKYLGHSQANQTNQTFLGVRGAYEILNGSRLYEDWVKKAKFLELTSLGICEKNTLAGALKFQLACQKENIKPIIGATYTVFRESEDYRYDIKLYVQNETGWDNLLAINKEVNVLNNKFVNEHRLLELLDGLFVVLDPKSIDFEKLFPLDLSFQSFYYQLDTVEYVNNDRDKWYLENLKKFIRSSYKPVSITDAFYLDKEDNHIKNILNSISSIKDYDSNNQYFKDKEDYFSELETLFNKEDDSLYGFYQKSLFNEMFIANNCNFVIETGNKHLPKYIMTDEEKAKYSDNIDMFWSLIEDGLRSKNLHDSIDRYLTQIQKEYDIIDYGNLQDYFLINWEQIEWCKKNNIMTGLARGSAAGFQSSYLLDVTKIDPFDYDLIAERFLTKERAKHKIADIDIDHEQLRRDEVKQHLIDKYGFDQCCSVGTYTTFQIKGGLKDLARVETINFSEVNYISSLLDKECKEWKDIFSIANKKPRLKNFVQKHANIINDLLLVLNSKKSTSIHASAFIITPSDKTIYEWMPVRIENKNNENILVSEWEGVELEEAGFLKQDILGLLQLDKFHNIVDLVKDKEIDIYNIPLNDSKVFQYFTNGWNNDIFQFGTKGLTEYCKQLKPTNINDLIAAFSLYRPGAMDNNFHNEYILRKEGKREIEYYSGTEEITKNTYGLLVYQEQVMQICQKLANFDLAETDDIRKALGKKKADVLEPYKNQFIKNSVKNGYNGNEMVELWNAMEKFSGYSFNLSHAAAYAITGYISQWLKVHYPIEFWSTAFQFAKEDDIANYISEINLTGDIKVMPADINKSRNTVFTDFDTKTIYWPLESIKQCGEKAAQQIIELRDRDGEYFSFEEFLSRNKFKGSKVNKSVIENLVMSGAFDETDNVRSYHDRFNLISFYRTQEKVKVDKDKDLFSVNEDLLSYDWWWTLQQKKLSGIAFFDYNYLLDKYIQHNVDIVPVEDFQNESYSNRREKVKIGGYIVEVEEKTNKKGTWCRILLESNYTFVWVTMWSEQYEQIKSMRLPEKQKSILLLSGEVIYDSYKQENILLTTNDTEILILE